MLAPDGLRGPSAGCWKSTERMRLFALNLQDEILELGERVVSIVGRATISWLIQIPVTRPADSAGGAHLL